MLRYLPAMSAFCSAQVSGGQHQRLIMNRIGLITLQRGVELNLAVFACPQRLEVGVGLQQLGLQTVEFRADIVRQAQPDRIRRLARCVPLGEQGILHLLVGFDLRPEQLLNIVGVQLELGRTACAALMTCRSRGGSSTALPLSHLLRAT